MREFFLGIEQRIQYRIEGGFLFVHLGDWDGVDKIHDVDVDHEQEQNGHAQAMHQVFKLSRHAAADDEFGQNEDDASAIERREWEEVENAKADGQRGDQFKRRDEPIKRLGCRRRLAGFDALLNAKFHDVINTL